MADGRNAFDERLPDRARSRDRRIGQEHDEAIRREMAGKCTLGQLEVVQPLADRSDRRIAGLESLELVECVQPVDVGVEQRGGARVGRCAPGTEALLEPTAAQEARGRIVVSDDEPRDLLRERTHARLLRLVEHAGLAITHDDHAAERHVVRIDERRCDQPPEQRTGCGVAQAITHRARLEVRGGRIELRRIQREHLVEQCRGRVVRGSSQAHAIGAAREGDRLRADLGGQPVEYILEMGAGSRWRRRRALRGLPGTRSGHLIIVNIGPGAAAAGLSDSRAGSVMRIKFARPRTTRPRA